ncbi:MAG: ABC transporter permease [Ancalomicrobiaceae bacterium]|nr:ABC transporter permease [Ancalomicrobiaceae bacterium]
MLEGSIRRNLLMTLPALVLVTAMAAITAGASPSFLGETNLANLSSRLLPVALATLGQAIVLFAGCIDLSVGSVISLATALMATLSVPLGWAVVPLTLIAGALCGAVTAAGIDRFRINPLVMSLASAAMVKGVTLLILPSPGGEVDYGFYALLFESDRLVAPPLAITLLVYALATILLGWSRMGRIVYGYGSDPRAAFARGASPRRVVYGVYIVSGMLAAAAGMVLSIRILSGDPLIGDAYTLDTVSAAILGGVALTGGRGNVIGALFAAAALVLINNTFNLLELDTNLQSIAKGLIFILALVFFMRGKAGEA